MKTEIIKGIFDISEQEVVDLGIAAAKYRSLNTDIDTTAEENFIHKNYSKLCELYGEYAETGEFEDVLISTFEDFQ